MLKKTIIVFVLLIQMPILGQNYKFGKVSKGDVEETVYSEDSTAVAAYFYKYRRSYFDWDVSHNRFNLITDIHQRIKIYNKEGFKYANHFVKYYRPDIGDDESVFNIKGYTYYLEDGNLMKEKLSKKNIFKEKLNKYYSKVKITMPKIKEGCVIEIKYQIISPYPTSIADVEFQKGIPIKKLVSKLEIPEFYSFNKRSKGYVSIPMEESSRGGNVGDTDYRMEIYTFEGENIEALKDNEPYVVNANNYRGGVKFELASVNYTAIGGRFTNYTSSWDGVSEKIFKSASFGEELKRSNYYKKDLENILINAKTETEKISRIYEFVKSKVKWNGFYGINTDKGVRKAFKENSGNVADINLMLTSMLRNAGLDADPVLISSKGNGVPIFPTIKGFDYVIALVRFSDSSYLLLDATEEFGCPNTLPERAINWNGRVLYKNGASSWVKLTSKKHVLEDNNVMVKLSDDLTVEGLIRTKFESLKALNFRKRNNHIKLEDLMAKYEEQNNIEVEDLKIQNKEKITKPIVRVVKFLSEDLVEEINGKLYIEPLLFLAKHENPFKADERKFPVDYITPWKKINRISLEIPEGYSIEKIPEPMAIALPDNLGVFKYQVKSMGNRVSAISILQLNSALISSQYYTFLKDFYTKLVEKESEKIIITKI